MNARSSARDAAEAAGLGAGVEAGDDTELLKVTFKPCD